MTEVLQQLEAQGSTQRMLAQQLSVCLRCCRTFLQHSLLIFLDYLGLEFCQL